MKKFLMNVKEKCSTTFGKALVVTSTGAGALMLGVSAHAEDTSDISGITGQITTGLTSAKTEFVTALGAVVVVALGFFVVKFVVRQVIGYFAKVASK
ncbi:hypothetical protein [Clostridium beijerinckii]|uniref:hypothetical protein n=1 Tax=Clostridium beijerinckii TaxID=1520 RepID=UPI0024317EAE|nr:hypothetical protein [Clostridium beijerinckii]MDG5857069.1 hypothetical protein [Clostridium beijerinckii]